MKAGSRKPRHRKPAKPVADLLEGVMAPILARRAAMSYQLVAAWPQLVDPEFAATTRPERIRWPRKSGDSDPFQPGILVVACDGGSAVILQHEADRLIERVNAFLGFHAVARLKILQKPVGGGEDDGQAGESLSADDIGRIRRMLGSVEDPELRVRLEKLGQGILRKKRRRG
jgi:hypothetical protein